ncbi:hypothetical protein [Brevibacillus sp. AY1]|uniref:hypothetical protein n=1 Tax=Brevibacillus sp. AY1 TaxID=2807621 RepID=UPI0024549D4C|nr:hypothetical protein [Brevibacillus sp. AY1]MDH4619555.1 hypothetical protein [Brevibacillus sp. AY1]
MLSKAKMGMLFGSMAAVLSLGVLGSAYAADADQAKINYTAEGKQGFGIGKMGHHGFGGGFAVKENADLLALLNLDAEELQEALKAGKSLAEVAEEQGVDKQEVVDLLLEQQADKLAEAVKAGKLTQEQADKMSENASERIQEQVENTHAWKGMGKGFGGFGQSEELLALLDMEAAELQEALKAGKSLAGIAEEQGVDKDDVIELLVQQQADKLAEAVKAGKLTQEQADQKLAESKERASKMVEGTFEKGAFPGKKKDSVQDNPTA